jgi:DNA-nicking Smr family endonuclease
MPKPPPDPGEANWRRIKATVKPLKGKRSPPAKKVLIESPPVASEVEGPAGRVSPPKGTSAKLRRSSGVAQPVQPPAPPKPRGIPSSLDGTWDRRIRTGRLEPDLVVDLHGHSLASAHTHLARALDRAARQGARVILLIAGKQRGPDEAPRGAIRRELESWLAHSGHARRIAAVRNAHPRHGGAGALYLVLRKAGD